MNVNGIEWVKKVEQDYEGYSYDTYTTMIEGSEVVVSGVISYDGPVWTIDIVRQDNPDDPLSPSMGYGGPLEATTLTEALLEAVETEKTIRHLLVDDEDWENAPVA